MLEAAVHRVDGPSAGDAVGLHAMDALELLDRRGGGRIELRALRQTQPLAKKSDAVAGRIELEHRPGRDLHLRQVAPAHLVADERLPQLRVDRVHRREHVHVRRLEIVIALLLQLGVALLDRRRDLAVDVDHVETLLDTRWNLDGLDRLLAGCERRSGQA